MPGGRLHIGLSAIFRRRDERARGAVCSGVIDREMFEG